MSHTEGIRSESDHSNHGIPRTSTPSHLTATDDSLQNLKRNAEHLRAESAMSSMTSEGYASDSSNDKVDTSDEPKDESGDWSYNVWLDEWENNRIKNQIKRKHLALTWRNLTVTGVDSRAVMGDNILSYANPMNLVKSFRGKSATTVIIDNLTGQVRPGEMMLVLGRPGSGCTSFLKAVSNKHAGYKSVEGEIFYGSLEAHKTHKYRGAVLYNSEEDIHFPSLTVGQTLGFAVQTKIPRYDRKKGGVKEQIGEMFHVFGRALGIAHTKDTFVGNEYVRGVSGGERKRVSVAEVMAAGSSITCWDNATRGLDAGSALNLGKTFRAKAVKSKATILATLYQTGNDLFNEFDKILVLDSGRGIYYGPRELAKSYFEDLGFLCPPGANTADFLTSVTVPTERQIKPGFENTFPKTAAELESIYRSSHIATMMGNDMVPPREFDEKTNEAKEALRDEKPKYRSPLQSSYTVSLRHQVLACIIRQVQIMNGDRASILMQQGSAVIQALVSGSLYYNLPDSSVGIFSRTSALFYALIFFCLSSMSETTASFMGRPILARHRDFSLYRPTAYVIARAIVDVPNTMMQASLFSVVFYFMVNFQVDAGKFFTYWVIVIVSTLCFVSCFRMLGSLFKSFDNASKFSGLWSTVMMVYAGYFVAFNKMHPWFKWLFWLNPAGYAYEALMANEFHGLTMTCTGNQLVPNGDDYPRSTTHKVCTVAGATSDNVHIVGENYIKSAYDFSQGHLWRNFGVLIAWWLIHTFITAIALEKLNNGSVSDSSLIFKRGKETKNVMRQIKDEEKGDLNAPQVATPQEVSIARNEAVFTWDHLSYTVNVAGGQRQLLDNISGWVKPGTLGALMGSSGAGKTTLLDVLAQRKDSGIITGEVLVDGRPLPVSFQRSAGYCEQMDVHESTATVREALIFSARLRQSADVPDDEKLAYVDSVISLLEMQDIEHALIGTVGGAGLTVEQRKRVTIGVELAARPSVLLFLDEPTSGLDGQAAFNVIRFLRRLTAAGQAVLCTIHQPSALLFEAFDSLLLLAKGGKTVYFGETGTNSSVLLDYFARNGFPCHPEMNPADHIIDAITGDVDWHSIWLRSDEKQAVDKELKRMKEEALSKPMVISDDASDFATSLFTQLKIVVHRQQIALWRNPEYVWNKIFLHVTASLFGGFTFWMIDDGSESLQTRLLAVFNFVFVAVGAISQLQPMFLINRSIFETREKKAKMYSWLAFVTGQLVAEFPYLIICGTIYFCCFYFTAGLPIKASTSGQVYFQMLLYEFLYTSIGQAIAAISPNALFASLLNPVVISAFLINFCGILVPYDQIVVFWRFWMYYLNPFTYLMGGLLVQIVDDVTVTCKKSELSTFSPPSNQTCGEYMYDFFANGGYGYIVNNDSTTLCEYCEYKNGGQYLDTLNLPHRYDGWRDTALTFLFCLSSYGLVFLMMKLRSKKTLSASG